MALDDEGGRTLSRADTERGQQGPAIPSPESAENIGASVPRIETPNEAGDRAAIHAIEDRAAERAAAGADLPQEVARQHVQADAADMAQIKDAGWQHQGALVVAENAEASPAYKEALRRDFPELAEQATQAENTSREIQATRDARDVQIDPATAERGNARAEAFEQLPQTEALAKHPELDGAYAQLREVRETLADKPVPERDAAYAEAKTEISNELRRGEIPEGPVTHAESERVIDLAAAERGIRSVRDGDDLARDVKGEVVATSSQHALVAISDDIAVRFEKSALDRDVQQGDKVAIQYEEGKSQVHEQGKEPQAEVRDMAHDMAR